MDRQQFEQIKTELLELTYKNPLTRKLIKQRIRRGMPEPKSGENTMTYIVKPKLKPCEDCSVISTNTLKHISQEYDRQGRLRWMKRCDECGKKTVFHRRISASR